MTIFQRWLVLSWSILLSLPGPLNIAFAASPPSSSIRNGEVFQKDLGPQNAQLAKAISSFDPDETWSPVEEPTLRRELVRAGGLFLHPSMQRGRYASILEFSHCRTQQKSLVRLSGDRAYFRALGGRKAVMLCWQFCGKL
jgi:Protein of unknown function (DUF2950)